MKRLAMILLGITIFAGIAYAATTADPIVMGFLTTSGCPSGQSSCFVPYTAANPLPVQM